MTTKAEAVKAIKLMAATGNTRDDVMMWMFQNGIKPSKMNGYIKDAVVTFGRAGSGWRQATARYFAALDLENESPNYDDWKVLMQNEGDPLLSENNQAAYTNHFKLWVAIKSGGAV